MLDIKSRRLALGISQSDLAILVAVNQTAVSQWERGVTVPTLDKAMLLAKAFGCTIDDLFKSQRRPL